VTCCPTCQGINSVWRYEPASMPQHPEFGALVRIVGILYDPATATVAYRTLSQGGQYDIGEDTFRTDYLPVHEPRPCHCPAVPEGGPS
jgi:hypothetical protein